VNRAFARHLGTAAAAALVLVASACAGDDAAPTPGAGQSTGTPSRSQSTPPAATQPVTPQPIPTGDPTRTPAGGLPRQVNTRDATAVAIAVAAVTYRHDTAIDYSPTDAQRRARQWLAPALARQLTTGPVAAPGAEWNTWAKHLAYTTSTAVDATESGAPADTAAQADRTITVTVRAIGRDRWRGPIRRYAVYVTMARTGATGAWRVSQLQVQD